MVESAQKKSVDDSFAMIAKRTMMAEANIFDDIDEMTEPGNDNVSLGDSSYASLGSSNGTIGSIGEHSIVSNASMMPPMHVSTDVTIARAMARFNKRKSVYDKKQTLTANARATLLKKVHNKKMKAVRMKKARR